MTSDFKRLIDDPQSLQAAQELLKQARNCQNIQYDFEAGLLRHQSMITSGVASPKWADASFTGGLKGLSLLKIGAIISLPIAGAALVWGSWILSEHLTDSQGKLPSRQDSYTQHTQTTELSMAEPEGQMDVVDQLTSQEVGETPSTTNTSSDKGNNRKPSPEKVKGKNSSPKPGASTIDHSIKVKRSTLPRPMESEEIQRREESTVEPGTDYPGEDSFSDSNSLNGDPSEEPAAFASRTVTQEIEQTESPKQAAIKRSVANSVLKREMRLLVEARGLIRRDPSRSLLLVNTTRPKTGILNEEWDQVRLLALLKLGRFQEVRAGMERFHRQYPNSVFNERIRREFQQALNE